MRELTNKGPWLAVVAVLLAGLVGGAPAGAKEVALPSGVVVGAVVGADGEIHVVLRRGETHDGYSVLVRLDDNTARTIEEVHGEIGSLAALTENRFLLTEFLRKSHGGGGRAANRVVTVVELGRDGFERFASWQLKDYPEWHHTEPPPIAFSGDGRTWGVGGARNFFIGRMRASDLEPAPWSHYSADLGGDSVSAKWLDGGSQDSIFLDSEGPVVLEPWHRGAYIVHYSDTGSPYVVPILFHDGVEEWEYVWQWEERVLWASTSRYWKAYHLWDLGLTPPSEPFWVSDSASARPHAERGIVEVHRNEGSYRVEHIRVDPWSGTVERHVSDWYEGAAPIVDDVNYPGFGAPARVFVSANGDRGVVIGHRHLDGEEGGFVNVARRFRLHTALPRDAVEVDAAREESGDREAMGSGVLQRIAEQVESSDQQE